MSCHWPTREARRLLSRAADAKEHTRLALAAVLLLGLGLRGLFFSGYPGTDDRAYIEAARRVSVGDLGAFDSYFAARSGLVFPTAVAYAVFGPNLVTTALLPLVSALGELILAYALGTELFGATVGLLSALLLSFFPLDVIFSSQLLACVPVAFWAGLTVFLLIRGESDGGAWASCLAGVSLGVASLMAETVWFCLLPVGYFFAFVGARRNRLFWFAAGLLIAPAVEALGYLFLVGDPLVRWHALEKAVAVQGTVDALSSGLGVAYFLRPFARLVSEQEFGLFSLLIVPALAWHGWRAPSRYSRFLVCWVVAIFLYSAYGTTSPLRYAPLARLPRYLSSATIPAMVLAASFLIELRVWLRLGVVAMLCATSIVCVWVDNGRDIKAPRKALHRFIARHPDVAVVLDEPLMFDERVFSGFRTNPQLIVFAEDEKEAHHISARPAIYGPARIVRDLRAVRGAFVAVTRPYGLAQAARFFSTPPIVTFRPADRLYYRLLRLPWFLSLLSLVRDRYRMEGMRDLAAERIEVYRAP